MTLKRTKQILPLLLSAILCVFLFKMPALCSRSVKEGIDLCGNVVIPSLFLFMVAANFWLESGFSAVLGKWFGFLTRHIFALPDECGGVLFMGMVGGFPVGINMTAQLYSAGRISKMDAFRMCLFCLNAGPAFVISAVGFSLLKSTRAGILLFASCVLAALILGFFTRFIKGREENLHAVPLNQNVVTFPSPAVALANSVSRAAHSMLSVCAWVILFYTVTACLHALSLPRALELFLNCILEVTVGLKSAAGKFPLPVLAAILSFGGFSVHCQVLSDLNKCGVGFKYFLVSRIICAALSAFICACLLKFFPCEISVFASSSTLIPAPYSVSAPAFVALLFMSMLLILEVDTDRKVC